MTGVERAYLAFSLERTLVTAGRLRLRVPAKRVNEAFFQEITARLTRVEGVLEVLANPKTASLLILHDDEDGQAVLARIGQLGILKICRRDQLADEERVIQLTEKEQATLRFLAFSGIALYQAWQGKLFAASSALASEARQYWEKIPRDDVTEAVSE